MLRPGSAIQTLLAGLIDYAGLYPPASLDMRRALDNYFAYRGGRHAFALGRFIVDSSRIEELRAAAGDRIGNLKLSVIVSSADDSARLSPIVDHGIGMESVETKLSDRASLDQIRNRIPANVEMYVELPVDAVSEETLAPVAAADARIKLRMGGVVPEAIPAALAVARALGAIAARQIMFKGTAGLHHPVRSRHLLTYAQNSPSGLMHGFVNLLGASALLHFGGNPAEAEQILEEQDPGAWALTAEGLAWRAHRWTIDQISETRKRFVSFGSCSFEEPIRDLEAMGWL